MKPLLLIIALSACASPPPAPHIAHIPVSPGYLPPYAQMQWSMSVYEFGTSDLIMRNVGVFDSQQDCQIVGASLGNSNVYAVCRPLPNA